METTIKNIKKAIKNPRLAVKYLVSLFLFYKKYYFIDFCEVDIDGIKIKNVTDNRYLKRLCFPRSEHGWLHEPVVARRLINTLKKKIYLLILVLILDIFL